MNSINDIKLTKTQSEELNNNLIHPDKSALEKRDKFLTGIVIEYEQNSTSFSVEILD